MLYVSELRISAQNNETNRKKNASRLWIAREKKMKGKKRNHLCT